HAIGRPLLRPAQHLERPFEPRLRPHARIEPRDGLDVVVQDLRTLREYDVERRDHAAEIRDEHLDRRAWRLTADLTDRLGEHLRAAILELVPIDARHDGVLDAHPRDGLAHPGRLGAIELVRLSGLHRAEAARSGARV